MKRFALGALVGFVTGIVVDAWLSSWDERSRILDDYERHLRGKSPSYSRIDPTTIRSTP